MGTRGALGAPRRVPPSRGSEREVFKRILALTLQRAGTSMSPTGRGPRASPAAPPPPPSPDGRPSRGRAVRAPRAGSSREPARADARICGVTSAGGAASPAVPEAVRSSTPDAR